MWQKSVGGISRCFFIYPPRQLHQATEMSNDRRHAELTAEVYTQVRERHGKKTVLVFLDLYRLWVSPVLEKIEMRVKDCFEWVFRIDVPLDK
jgi:hypothetical protein